MIQDDVLMDRTVLVCHYIVDNFLNKLMEENIQLT